MQLEENKDFLTTQILTYLGNKRGLIGVQNSLFKKNCLFS